MGVSYKRARREALLAVWPPHSQAEALAELQMCRPGKWLLLQAEILAVRERYPAPGDDPLEAARTAASAAVVARANAIMAALSAEYGEMERQTWDQQAVEAAALSADASAPAPMLRAIAAARGMDAATLAGRVLANKAAWGLLSGAIIGKRLALQDAIEACASMDELRALDLDSGWPGS